MIVNPAQTKLQTIGSTRFLTETFGLLGTRVVDPENNRRIWTVSNTLAPVPGLAISGVRLRLVDDKGFSTFCNQRDFELISGMAKPGDLCPWTGQEYPETNSSHFFGLCMDKVDWEDDTTCLEFTLRELMQESGYGPTIPYGYQLNRRLHVSPKTDVEEVTMMLDDIDEFGNTPAVSHLSISERWVNTGRMTVTWDHL
jgi:hypothetical protein